MEKINVGLVKAVKNSGEESIIINVLPKENFLREHIPGSINIPFLDATDFVQQVESIVPSKNFKIIVYCGSTNCMTSEKAAKKLDQAGFSSVLRFEGGMQEWKEAEEPIEKGLKGKKFTL